MLEILEFIFRGFWTFLGCLMLLGAIASIFSSIFSKATTINNFNTTEKEN